MNGTLKYLTGGALLFSTGCTDMYVEHLVGNYYLIEADYVDIELSLSYKLKNGDYTGVVNPTLFAVGYDDEYIIAKRHPHEFGYPVNKSVTHYYIVPLKYNVHASPDGNRTVPLSREEFERKRIELNISNELTFSRVFKKLE
jgi:hypothetical protein